MNLLSQQQLFATLVPRLMDKALSLGYSITIGDCYRDPRVFGKDGESKGYGHKSSCHKFRLAIDLNLFKDGMFLQDSEDHRQLGEWWEQQHPDCRWGGRFNDGNHYSLEWQGRK